jgi:hypothetical protein
MWDQISSASWTHWSSLSLTSCCWLSSPVCCFHFKIVNSQPITLNRPKYMWNKLCNIKNVTRIVLWTRVFPKLLKDLFGVFSSSTQICGGTLIFLSSIPGLGTWFCHQLHQLKRFRVYKLVTRWMGNSIILFNVVSGCLSFWISFLGSLDWNCAALLVAIYVVRISLIERHLQISLF